LDIVAHQTDAYQTDAYSSIEVRAFRMKKAINGCGAPRLSEQVDKIIFKGIAES